MCEVFEIPTQLYSPFFWGGGVPVVAANKPRTTIVPVYVPLLRGVRTGFCVEENQSEISQNLGYFVRM